MTDQTQPAEAGGFSVTDKYRKYVLGLLLVVYTFNYLDRQILSILLEPIKHDLQLSDTALGFLTGIVFALFYATLGVPIAMFADRANRKKIIGVALAIWSGMTALSGTATSFLQLAFFRIGVGVGEAGGSPPAYSLLSDYFPPEKRSTALGIYSLGVPFGILFGFLIGSQVYELVGWRAAFFVVGIPGVLLAFLVWFTVKEPPRGHSEVVAPSAADADAPSFMDTVRFIMKRKTLVHAIAGATLISFTGYGFVTWAAAFLIRTHGMSVGDVGLYLSMILGIFGGMGTFSGGYFADKLQKRDPRWQAWVVAIPSFVTAPFGVAMFLVDSKAAALILMTGPAITGSLFLGPSLAMVQNLVQVRMRAVAGAFFLFVLNLIAMGGGPQFIGIMSDVLEPTYGTDALRYSLLIGILFSIWGACHYLMAARTLEADQKRIEEGA